ncbi:hypothetical protein ACOMHN_016823 [Nucella lapillus]
MEACHTSPTHICLDRGGARWDMASAWRHVTHHRPTSVWIGAGHVGTWHQHGGMSHIGFGLPLSGTCSIVAVAHPAKGSVAVDHPAKGSESVAHLAKGSEAVAHPAKGSEAVNLWMFFL